MEKFESVKEKLKDDLMATGADEKTKNKYMSSLYNLTKTRPGVKTNYDKEDLKKILADLDKKENKFCTSKSTKRWYYYFLHHLVTNILGQKWPLSKRYIPNKPEPHEVEKKIFSKQTVEEKLIKRGKGINPELRFLNVVSTVYGIRRIELCNLTEEDVNGGTIYIKTRKGGEARTHIIPSEIKEYLKSEYANDRVYDESTMTRRFYKLENAVGVEHERGFGWHSIRRRLATELNTQDNGLDREEIFNFMRWSRFTDRLDEYTVRDRNEMSMDQEKVDRKIFEVHPFLEVWR